MFQADPDQDRRSSWSLHQWEEDKTMLAVLANARRFVDMVKIASSVGHESMVADGKRSTRDTQKVVRSSQPKERESTRKEDQRIDCGGEGDDRCHSAAAMPLVRESAPRQHDKVERGHVSQDRQRSSLQLLMRRHADATDRATVAHQKGVQWIGLVPLVVFVYASVPGKWRAA
jgi:hypothetical protein